jgi:hypothetical protein
VDGCTPLPAMSVTGWPRTASMIASYSAAMGSCALSLASFTSLASCQGAYNRTTQWSVARRL